MKLTPQITFRNINETESIVKAVQKRLDRLERYFERIMGCRVLVEAPHRHHHQGNHFHVRVDLTVPGKEIIVNRDPSLRDEHTDLYVAIRDAFDATTRRLQDYVRERRGEVKQHSGENFRVLHPVPVTDEGVLGEEFLREGAI